MMLLRRLITSLMVVCLLFCGANVMADSGEPDRIEYEGFEINSGLNDAWYDPLTEGQGFTITVFEDKGTVSLTWFTYDTVLPEPGVTANLGDPGQRWLVAVGPYEGAQAELVVYSAGGGL